ncbi:MAG TPA: DNRLRE domain-containing protein [Bacteroidales bacterium]|nr:DNRLRE domain-containing protein [Bacteroidales bacterium]HRZ49574.1 DNRLRE domain-containing protein [Bacteroidales bacterium]
MTLTLQPGPLTGIDAHLKEVEPNVVFDTTPDFIAYYWTFNGLSSEGRSLIRFDLSQLPSNAVVIDAKLSLYHNPTGSSAGHYGVNESVLKMVTSPWSESTVTWATQPLTTNYLIDTLETSTTATQNYLNIDVTPQVSQWCQNPSSNYGWMIEPVIKSTYRSMKFASSDNSNSAIRPKLVITYDTLSNPVVPCPNYTFNQITICEGDSALLQGAYQKTAGLYFDTLTNVSNQDSIKVTALHTIMPYVGVKTFHICHGDSIWLAGAYQTVTGFYIEYLSTILGCDSIIHNQLEVTKLDNTTTLNGIVLSANQSGATYQWVDCELGMTPIAGATQQTYTPSINGSYAVIIQKNGCIAISPCTHVSGIKVQENGNNDHFNLIPNPADETVNVLLTGETGSVVIEVYNADGQLVYTNSYILPGSIKVNLTGMSSGVYLIRANTGEKIYSQRLVKR